MNMNVNAQDRNLTPSRSIAAERLIYKIWQKGRFRFLKAPPYGWGALDDDTVLTAKCGKTESEHRLKHQAEKAAEVLGMLEPVVLNATKVMKKSMTDRERMVAPDNLYCRVCFDLRDKQGHGSIAKLGSGNLKWRLTFDMSMSVSSIRSHIVASATKMLGDAMLEHHSRPTETKALRAWLERWDDDGELQKQFKKEFRALI